MRSGAHQVRLRAEIDSTVSRPDQVEQSHQDADQVLRLLKRGLTGRRTASIDQVRAIALGMSVKERGDTGRLTAAVWRNGQVVAASTSLGGGNDDVVEAVEAVVAGLAFRPLLRQWERAVLAEEIRALSDENTPALTLSGNRR